MDVSVERASDSSGTLVASQGRLALRVWGAVGNLSMKVESWMR